MVMMTVWTMMAMVMIVLRGGGTDSTCHSEQSYKHEGGAGKLSHVNLLNVELLGNRTLLWGDCRAQ